MEPTSQWPRGREVRVGAGILAAGAAIAAVPAAAAVWTASADPLRTSAELLVALAYSALALLPSTGLQTELQVRVAAAVTAALWVTGALVPGTATAHQAGLAWLLAAAAGGVRGVWGVTGLAAIAVALASGLLPTPASAAVFAGLSAWAGVRVVRPTGRGPAFAAAVAAGLVAVALLSAWVAQASMIGLAPRTALLLYCCALVSAAALVGAAAVGERRHAARLREAASAAGDATGLVGLEAVLQATLHDETLRLVAPFPSDGSGEPGPDSDLATTDITDDAGAPVARILHRPDSLAEPAVERALADAVLLAVEHDRLQQRLEAQRREIARTRADLQDAAQAGRLAVARRVEGDVLAPLREGSRLLAGLRGRVGPSARSTGTMPDDALEIASVELQRAEEDLLRVVDAAGAPELGDGRLASELRALARPGVPTVDVAADANATGDAPTETALYYLASEALANAMKHADASRIDLRLTRSGDDMLRLEVSDDGRGGAESGAAIRRRVDALAGELSLESPPGRGTRVTVAVPRRRSASTAR